MDDTTTFVSSCFLNLVGCSAAAALCCGMSAESEPDRPDETGPRPGYPQHPPLSQGVRGIPRHSLRQSAGRQFQIYAANVATGKNIRNRYSHHTKNPRENCSFLIE